MQPMIDLERRKLLEVAREYRKQGYEVLIDPSQEQLPAILTPFQPDIIARNNKETVVIEIKSRRSLSKSPEMTALAALIQQQAGWRFELIVTNSKDQGHLIEQQDALLAKQAILARLKEVRLLLHQEHGEAAVLLAWSAAEAIFRRLLIKERVSAENTTASMLKSLFVHGLIDKNQYETLRRGIEVRDTILNGHRETELSVDFTNKLLNTMEQLVEH